MSLKTERAAAGGTATALSDLECVATPRSHETPDGASHNGDATPSITHDDLAVAASSRETGGISDVVRNTCDIQRIDFVCECAWQAKEKLILLREALADGDVQLARMYWEVVRLIGREISRTLAELGRRA